MASWQSILDDNERRRRQQQPVAVAPTATLPAPSEAPKQEDGGFFGGLARGAGDFVNNVGKTAEDVGSFFGGIAKDFVDTTKEAVGTVGDLIKSPQIQSEANKKIEQVNARNKEWSKTFGQLPPEQLNNPDTQAKSQAFLAETKRISDESTQLLKGDNIQNRDPLKSAAAVAETGLNVATLGGAAAVENLAKGAGKQIIKSAAKGSLKDVAKQTAKLAVRQGSQDVAETGGRAAVKTIAGNAAEGATYGAAYGALAPLKHEGQNATPDEILQSALTGGATGGVLGGASSLLDRNVRSEAAALPGNIRAGVGSQYDAYRALPQSVREGGYIGNPLADNTPRPDWAPTGPEAAPVQPADAGEEYAQGVAAQYKNADAYLKDATIGVKSYDDAAVGGQKIDTYNPDAPYTGDSTVSRVSNHSTFYRDYYKQNGRKPSLAATKEAVRQALETGKGHDLVHPEEARIYQILKERDAANEARTMDPSAPAQGIAGQADEFQSMLTGQPAPRSRGVRPISGLPKGPLDGQEVLPGTKPPADNFNSPQELQTALGRMESRSNPLIDYIDPRARMEPVRTGQQMDLPTTQADPYAGRQPDLTLPALPAGELPKPVTPSAAKRDFAASGTAPEFVNTQKAGEKPIPLAATTDEVANIATRQTKSGKIVPVATNNAHITNDEVGAIRAIAEDNTGSAFTNTRTPEMNLEEALAKRGGAKAPEFKALNERNVQLREHMADYTRFVDSKRNLLDKIVSEYKLGGKAAQDSRPFLEAADEETSKAALEEFRKSHGDEAAQGLVRLRKFWRADHPVVRNETNAVIEKFAGKDRTMGDLGETYVPRVYKRGAKGFKDSVLDVVHAGMDKLGGKNGLMNLENPNGYLSKESDTAATSIRSVNQAPLNSDVAKPNTTYLSAAQKRTAAAPVGQLEDPITSMMRYYEATGRAKYLTEDIARGRTLQKAIEGVNGESGNLRQMYDSVNDQINSISGKTNSFDQKFVNTETGNKFVNVAGKLQSRIARSTIIGSANSAFAQTGQLPLVAAENGAKAFTAAMGDMFRYAKKKTSPIDQSALMATRYPENRDAFTTKAVEKAGQKATDVIGKPFHLIEETASKFAWYSSYNKALADGLAGKEAVQEADRITAKLIGERSPGARASLYESKALGPITSYTLEVNQMYQVAKQYFKRDPKKAAALVGAIWLYNQGYKAVTGNRLNADPLQAGLDAKDILTNQDYTDSNGDPIGMGERLVRAGGRLAGEAVDATPLGGQVVGQLYPDKGFRIPFGGGERALTRADVFGDTNIGRYGGGAPIAAGISNPLLLLGIPGMAQAQRSVEGARAYNEGGVFNRAGDTKFDISQSPENYWRSLLLGMYSTAEGRAYLADQSARLAGQQVQ